MSRLRKFLETGSVPPPSTSKRQLALTPDQVADLFTLNLVLSALHACRVSTSLSEAAVDALCVAGLVQFPPTEAGPLNYAVRLGQKSLVSMYEECTKAVPFLSDVCGAKNPKDLLSSSKVDGLFSAEPSPDVECPAEGLTETFQCQKSELVLLTQQELKRVGRTHGLQSREVFVIPHVTLAFVLLIVWGVVAWLVVWWVLV